jgi:adenylate cyclase
MSGGRFRLAIGAAAGLLAAALHLTGAFDAAERRSWDWRVRNFAPGEVSDRVAVLAVDQASLDYVAGEQGLSWPWPRGLYVPILEYCRSAGARSVIFDILFTEFSSYGQGDDEELAGALAAGGDVVLALALHRNRPQAGAGRPPADVPAGDAGRLAVPFRGFTDPVDVLRRAAAGLGNVNTPPDDDGVFRRMPVAFTDGSHTVLPLALEAARIAGKNPRFRDGGFFLGDDPVPLDPDGRFVIPFRGPAGTIPSYSAASAIQSFIRMETGGEIPLAPQLLRDRHVFVGLTAPGLLDLRPTPAGAVYPGVEVHATVLDAVLRGDFLHATPAWAAVLACLALALAPVGALGRIRGAWLRGLALPAILLLLLAAAVAAYRAGVWVPVAAPAVAAVLAFLAVLTADYATEGRQRRFLKRAFRHYLSPQVVEEIVKDPSRLKLGGERKVLSIFFSDLAAFSSISEELEPEALTTLLNLYLSEMTDVIQEAGGTVDKFEGDAIVAFWNAPLDQPDHAGRAVTAAVRSLERLERINPELASLAGRPLAMRIGIHTGPVVVENLGSKERFDYSVIGDAANLASRLEGLGKVFRSPLIVSEDTWRAAGDTAFGREIGRVRVVGRSAPCRIVQPAGLTGEPPVYPWWRDGDPAFVSGLEAFYAGDVDGAATFFAGLPADPVAAAYRDRCAALLDSGLPGSWDGVWDMVAK